MIDVGYVVDDICMVGPKRGAYKVWVPKKHGDPTGQSDYSGFGINLGNLGAGALQQVQELAEYYFPLMPLSSGGHPPFNPDNGLTSVQENPNAINESTSPTILNGQVTSIKAPLDSTGYARVYQMRHTEGATSLMQTYSPGSQGGYSPNTHANSDKGSICRLNIGTRVAVCDFFIIGQLPASQNNLIHQIPSLNS